LAREPSDRAAELDGPARPRCLPERQLAVLAGRRGDDDAVTGDVLDPPGARAEQDHLTAPGFVDALLVEFADAGPVRHEHTEQAAVRDRAPGDDREPARALSRAHGALGPVPYDARTELREGVGRIAAGEHVEYADEDVL